MNKEKVYNALKSFQIKFHKKKTTSSNYFFKRYFNNDIDYDLLKNNKFDNLDMKKMEEIILWYRDDLYKTPDDRYALEKINYKKITKIQSFNENNIIQTILYIHRTFAFPIYSFISCLIIKFILIYLIYLEKFKIQIPIRTYIPMFGGAIIFRNNLFQSVRYSKSKLIYSILGFLILLILHWIDHIYYSIEFSKNIKIIYIKNKSFYKSYNNVINFVKSSYSLKKKFSKQLKSLEHFNNLSKSIYLKKASNFDIFINSGNIIADFYTISNKKNKLENLLHLVGYCDFIKSIS